MYEIGNHTIYEESNSPRDEECQRHRTECLKPQEERAASGTLLTDQDADCQDVRHRQCTQYQEEAFRG